MPVVADLTDTEQWIMRVTLRERYGCDLEIQLADAESRLAASDRTLTTCPVFSWQTDETTAVISSSSRSPSTANVFLSTRSADEHRRRSV